ncbi:SulP family inorganic anion transporter [Cyclobacterium sp.]|uniref:SulP family inorganic anion transporter n=1 Tax=unclassified Cyclobacterium TaxID=2615055 RepID=UPI00397091EE
MITRLVWRFPRYQMDGLNLNTAFIIRLITSIMGGRPGMISGATGAIAVIIVALVIEHGIEYLFAAANLMGLIQILVGWLKLGKLIRLVPRPVIFGFVNGLAIIIFMSQFSQFKVVSDSGSVECLSGNNLYIMLGLVVLTMAIIKFLPKLTKAVASSLAAILVIPLTLIDEITETRGHGNKECSARGVGNVATGFFGGMGGGALGTKPDQCQCRR